MMQEFNLQDQDFIGAQLIEANAGSGKTFTLSNLFIRLLLEKKMDISQILIITFTEAATAELKKNIRKILYEVSSFLNQDKGALEENPELRQLLESLLRENKNRPFLYRRIIRNSIIYFDQAAIFTIHGFCYRLIQENNFFLNGAGERELLADMQDFSHELIQDFWLGRFPDLSMDLQRYVSANKSKTMKSSEKLSTFLENFSEETVLPRQRITISKNRNNVTEKKYAQELHSIAKKMLAILENYKREIFDFIFTNESFSRASYRSDNFTKKMEETAKYLETKVYFKIVDSLKLFSFSLLTKALKKGKKYDESSPLLELFHLGDRFQQIQKKYADELEKAFIGLEQEFVDFYRIKSEEQKESGNNIGYQDLLRLVDQYLSTSNTEDTENYGNLTLLLKSRVREQFKAILIDEHQDTDQIQLSIITKIFDFDIDPVFFIGDPKQSIYKFRGANVYSYLRSRKFIPEDRQFSLSANWRSTPKLVAAINKLFNKENIFLHQDLHYVQSRAARKDTDLFKLKRDSLNRYNSLGDPNAPLSIRYLQTEDKIINKGDAQKKISKDIIRDILELLHSGYWRNSAGEKRMVSPDDIAILVRKNNQGEELLQALRENNLPVIFLSSSNIFKTVEALDFYYLLRSVIYYHDTGKIFAALLGIFFQWDDRELILLKQEANDKDLEKVFVYFRKLNQIYHREGILPLYQELIYKHGSKLRILQMPNGEEILSNLDQISEILHEQELYQGINPERDLEFLDRNIFFKSDDNSDPKSNDRDKLIFTDKAVIKILTIHKSKGLQFPIVYIPYLYDGLSEVQPPYWFYDSEKDFQLFLELRNKFKNKSNTQEVDALLYSNNDLKYELDELQENMRLAYVALTRARAQIFLYWGKIRNAATSSLFLLLHSRNEKAGAKLRDATSALPEALNQIYEKTSPDDILNDLLHLGKDLPESFLIEMVPDEDQKEGGIYREPRIKTALHKKEYVLQSITTAWQWSSFSAIVNRLQGMKQKKNFLNDANGINLELDSPILSDEENNTDLSRDTMMRLDEVAPLKWHPILQPLSSSSFSAQSPKEIPLDTKQFSESDLFSGGFSPLRTDPNNHNHNSTYMENFLNFPKGAISGQCLHEILEKTDFSPAGQNDTHNLIGESLDRFQIDRNWTNAVQDMISTLRRQTFTNSIFPKDEINLASLDSKIDTSSRELPFIFPLDKKHILKLLDPEAKSFFQVSEWDDEKFSLNSGNKTKNKLDSMIYMQGYIDMLLQLDKRFYIIDWKSNFLGQELADYRLTGMEKSMQEHNYYLQIKIYTLAAHRFLSQRFPEYSYEKNFGGVYYIFLRSFHSFFPRSKKEKAGFFFERPTEEFIQQFHSGV